MRITMQNKILIGEVCRLANCTPRTVRHYEDKKLIIPIAKTSGGHKYYGEETVLVIQTAQLLKRLGYSLSDIRQIINLTKSANTKNRQLSKKLRTILSEAKMKLDAELILLSSSRKKISNLLEETRKCEVCNFTDCGACGKLERLRALELIESQPTLKV